MNKGFISLGIVAIIAIVTVVAGGGTYGAYKYNQAVEEKNDLQREIEQRKNDDIADLKAEIEQLKSSSSATSSLSDATSSSTESLESEESDNEEDIVIEQTVQPAATTPYVPEPTVVDLCLNIMGVQTVVPSGYTAQSNICTLIPSDKCSNIEGVQASVPDGFEENQSICSQKVVEDKCFNIDGVQEEVPRGMLRDRTYGCVTEEYLESVAEAQRNEDNCDNTLDSIRALEQEIIDIQYEYQIKINTAKTQGGGLAGGANAEVSNLVNEMNSTLAPIEYERDTLNLEYASECN